MHEPRAQGGHGSLRAWLIGLRRAVSQTVQPTHSNGRSGSWWWWWCGARDAEDVRLRPQRLSQLVDLERESNEVLLLPIEHVVADGLRALLRQVLLAKDVELQERVLLHVLATASVLRHILKLLLGLLHIFLYAGKTDQTLQSR